MISRFFKKKPEVAEVKKTAPKPVSPEKVVKQKTLEPKRLLSAEGWKRLKMRKHKFK